MLPFIIRGHDQHGFFIQGWALGGAETMLRQAHGNQPPAEGAYLCIVPLLDAWRADRTLTEKKGEPHFWSSLEPAVLDDLKVGRALLLLDMSNEGPGFFANLFISLHTCAIQARIPLSRMVWLDQNRALGPAYRAAFGVGGSDDMIQFEHYDFFVKHIAWMFSPRAGAPVLGGDPEAHIARMYDASAKDRILLCLNATPRLHRVLTVAGLIHHGLFDSALVSFPGLDYAKDGNVGSVERLLDHLAHHTELAYLAESCVQVAALRELKVDAFTDTGNALFDKVDTKPYERTYFSLVTETELTGGEVDRVTEKIVKAFCLGHPSLVVGNPRALRFMTELGFHDFSHAIDPGYDREPDPARRLNRIFGQSIGLAMAIRHDPVAWLRRVREQGEANIRLATSGRLLDAYVARHERPLIDRLQQRLAAVHVAP